MQFAEAISPGARSSPLLTVVIIDADALARRAIHDCLEGEEDIEVIGEAPDASAGIELVRQRQPEVALIALSLLDHSGSDAMRELLAAAPRIRAITFAVEQDESAQLDAL